jgi:transposase
MPEEVRDRRDLSVLDLMVAGISANKAAQTVGCDQSHAYKLWQAYREVVAEEQAMKGLRS